MTHKRSPLRPLLSATAATGLALQLGGCLLFGGGYDGAYIERQDVSLEVPSDSGFRSTGEVGEVYTIIGETARDVNTWVAGVVEVTSAVTAYLNNYPETSKDGDWRVYGPIDDDDGRDMSWLVKIQGDASATSYQIWVGDRGASADAMVLLLDGNVQIDGDNRSGGFRLFAEGVEAQPELKDPEDAGSTFSGSIDVTFTRDVSTEEKTVDLTFNDWRQEYTLGDAWYSDETYAYRRDATGGGTFHLALYGTFDDQAWGGYQTNKVELDARWNPDEAGRARGQVLEVENADSALDGGDLVIHECFVAGGDLTYREINEPYAMDMPGYNMGDATACVFEASDLDG